MRPETNGHHILHYAAEWKLRKQAEGIRENRWLIPPMYSDVHTELHRDCPPVPLLGYHALQRMEKIFEPMPGDYDRTLDQLLFAIEEANEHPRSHQIEKDLGVLAIQAVELQRPYIQEGLVRDE